MGNHKSKKGKREDTSTRGIPVNIIHTLTHSTLDHTELHTIDNVYKLKKSFASSKLFLRGVHYIQIDSDGNVISFDWKEV